MPLYLGLLARIQERARTRGHGLPRVAGAADGLPGDALGELTLHLLDDGPEELVLAAEVVIERAAGDARVAHDLLGGHRAVAALREQLATRGDQCRAGLYGALFPQRCHTGSM